MKSKRAAIGRWAAAAAIALNLCAIGRVAAEPEKSSPAWRANLAAPHKDLAESLRSARVRPAGGPSRVRAVPDVDPRAKAVADGLRTAFAESKARGAAARAFGPPFEPAPRDAAPEKRLTIDGETVEVHRAPGSATPRLLRFSGGPKSARVATGATRIERDTETARALLRRHRDLLKIRDPDAEFRVLRAEVDDCGCCQVRFQQTYHGLDVWPSRLGVQVNQDGSAESLSGAFVPTPRRIVTTPTVSAAAAVAAARAGVAGGDAAEIAQPVLGVHAGVMGPKGAASPPRLAWKIEADVSAADRRLVFIDAHSGGVIENVNQVCFEGVTGSGVDLHGVTRPLQVWHQGNQFFMTDTSKQMFDPTSSPPGFTTVRGAIVIVDNRNTQAVDGNGNPVGNLNKFDVTSSSATSWQLPDAVSAAFDISQTYDYYLQRHGRDSIDGQGGKMLGIVRFSSHFFNAFWDGTEMVFGDEAPIAGAIDAVAHELTHGVTGATAQLRPGFQSGALNEAMSDIFGQMVELRATGVNDWLLGDSLPVEIRRDLRDPSSLQIAHLAPRKYPSKMSQFIVENEDEGGVHDNSTIISHAFYMLAEGLPNAVGVADAEKIFYRTDTVKLTPSAQFIDCRLAAIDAATDLFGAGSSQVKAVGDAFDAVEIFDAQPTAPPPQASPIDAANAALFVFVNPNGPALALGRRETALGDGDSGVPLIDSGVAPYKRPSITGDGATAAYVSADSDVVVVDTNGQSAANALGVAGQVYSLAVSPDGNKIAFVLQDAQQNPLNSITVVDLISNTSNTFPLTAPVFDGGSIDVSQADTMSFNRDGSVLVYDAFNVVTFNDGSQTGAWSIYGLDLADQSSFSIVSPIQGLDIGNPSFSQTSDRFIVFEALDSTNGETTVYTQDLFTGNIVKNVTVTGVTDVLAVPCYTGDDRAIVLSAPDTSVTSGYSLLEVPLADDHQTQSAAAALFLADADFGVVYRRGEVPDTPPPSSFDLTVDTGAPKLESLQCTIPTSQGDFPVSLALTHGVSGGYTNGGTCTIDGVPVSVSGRLTFNARKNAWIYSITAHSSSPTGVATFTGDVTQPTAKVVFKAVGVGKSSSNAAPVTLGGFFPTSQITLSPRVSVTGKITGTGTILGGFGNDRSSNAVLTGKITAKGTLALTLIDRQLGRKITFSGRKSGTNYVGKLTFGIPPAKGAIAGFVVPDLFGF